MNKHAGRVEGQGGIGGHRGVNIWPSATPDGNPSEVRPMIDLHDDATNQLIGSITEADLQVLVDAEESLDDHDYYIDAATIDVVADGKATEHLVKVLRAALGGKEGVDVRWQRR